MKKIAILGSTGSIGVSALDVVSKNPGQLDVVALAAGRNIDLFSEQVRRFRPEIVSVIDEAHARMLEEKLGPEGPKAVLWGDEGYRCVATAPAAQLVLSAIVGAAGLVPTLAAIEAGKDVALANKETLVTAGPLVIERARSKGVRLIPVDSEHSAVFQCIEGNPHHAVGRVILTASGGPFRRSTRQELERVTVADALKHPNWAMGRKITIDSATMMNKGLELIEACWLFGMPSSRIEVLIHPQSVVHSLVEFVDGSVLAQLGNPDMRVPIACGLSWPERIASGAGTLDLVAGASLAFEAPDLARFPCLAIAMDAARAGGSAPVVLNAANEIVVEAFLDGRLGFTRIAPTIAAVLDSLCCTEPESLEHVKALDLEARAIAQRLLQKG